MQFTTVIASLVLAATTVTAQGGSIYAVQTYFSGGGCTGTSDGEATFGATNLCQPLATVLGTVNSVKAISVFNSSCTIHYYTNSACTQGDTVGVIGQCQQANAPFVATKVVCP